MNRGVSLFEMLVTTAIFLVILTIVVVMLQSALRTRTASSQHDSSLGGARLLIDALRRDGEAATKLLSPALNSGSLAVALRLQRINPEADWLPSEMPTTPPTFWDPYRADDLIEVFYELESGQVRRSVFFKDGSSSQSLVAKLLGSLLFRSMDDLIEVDCTYLTFGQQYRSLKATVELRCLDRRP